MQDAALCVVWMVGQVLLPARILTDATACRIRIDATGIGHAMLTTQYDLRFYEVFHVQMEGTMVTAERAKFRSRHAMEMGRSDGHTERHTTAHTESTHGEKTEKTSVRGEVEGLRTGPKMGEHVGAEITVHDPARHCGPATVAASKLVRGEELRARGREMQGTRMQRHGEPNAPLPVWKDTNGLLGTSEQSDAGPGVSRSGEQRNVLDRMSTHRRAG